MVVQARGLQALALQLKELQPLPEVAEAVLCATSFVPRVAVLARHPAPWQAARAALLESAGGVRLVGDARVGLLGSA